MCEFPYQNKILLDRLIREAPIGSRIFLPIYQDNNYSTSPIYAIIYHNGKRLNFKETENITLPEFVCKNDPTTPWLVYPSEWLINPSDPTKVKELSKEEREYVNCSDPYAIDNLPNIGSDYSREELLEIWKLNNHHIRYINKLTEDDIADIYGYRSDSEDL